MRKSHERTGWLFWCRQCNIPLIAPRCSSCGASGKKLLLHHGVEIRPAFDYTLQKINRILEKCYGVRNALGESIVLLHKVAGTDRTEEIIVDGELFGTLAYIPEQKYFQFTLRSYGAHFLFQKGASKNVAIVNETALKRHIKNSWIYRQEIIDLKEVSGREDIILVVGQYIGVGVPKFANLDEMPEKCIKVRDMGRYYGHPKKATFAEMIEGNIKALQDLEQNATREIKNAIAKFSNYDIGVSFSGGKDSAVTMHLLSKCIDSFFVLFVDTGLEFPETVDYVKKMGRRRNVIILKPERAFWELVGKMGPPAKDYRWCCKVCKLAPIAEFVSKHGQKIVCVEGRRRAESFAREHIRLVEHNPFVPGQILVNPIRNWSSFHVWLYILWQQIEVNPLYYRDFERIGCYLCPAEHACEFDEVANLHPDLHSKWMKFLEKWGRTHSLDPDFWEKGTWRWNKPPRKVRGKERENKSIIVHETITCDGETILEGNFPFDLGNTISIENTLSILGETERRYDAIIVKNEKARILFFPNMDFSIVSKSSDSAKKVLVLMIQQLLRLKFCTSCEICIRTCPENAIKIKNGRPVYDLKFCKKCLKCIESCVVARYYDKMTTIVFETHRTFERR